MYALFKKYEQYEQNPHFNVALLEFPLPVRVQFFQHIT